VKPSLGPLGRFHEISLPTHDIRASVEFYERLGFSQAETGDTWSHPYGVVTDGRIVLGLHQSNARPAALTFVHPDVAKHSAALAERGIEALYSRTGTEVFNEIGLRDPTGQVVVIIEARTYSPVARSATDTSACGYFMQYSLPAANFDAARDFWERLGFVATAEAETAPYAHQPLTSDHLDLAFHAPGLLGEAALVFIDEQMPARIARLAELGVATSRGLPRALDARASALLEAPEGTRLLLLTGAD
jgi:catechol 2,3-dioxygenase-like lactoylglutathione lyase family enzyme